MKLALVQVFSCKHSLGTLTPHQCDLGASNSISCSVFNLNFQPYISKVATAMATVN